MVQLAALLGFLAVALGAFGAHGLKAVLSPYARDIYQTAVEYQFYHAGALLLVAILQFRFELKLLRWSAWALLLGTLVFSGSLYILAVTGISWLGAITPIGGAALLAGWLLLAVAASRMKAD